MGDLEKKEPYNPPMGVLLFIMLFPMEFERQRKRGGSISTFLSSAAGPLPQKSGAG